MSHYSYEEHDKLIEAVATNPAVYDLKHSLFKNQRNGQNLVYLLFSIFYSLGQYAYGIKFEDKLLRSKAFFDQTLYKIKLKFGQILN